MKKRIIYLVLGGLGVNILIALLGAPIFFILMLCTDNYFMVGGVLAVTAAMALGKPINSYRAAMCGKYGIRAPMFILAANVPSIVIVFAVFGLAEADMLTFEYLPFEVELAVALPLNAMLWTAPSLLAAELIWMIIAALRKKSNQNNQEKGDTI